jgi:hypothetical protein
MHNGTRRGERDGGEEDKEEKVKVMTMAETALGGSLGRFGLAGGRG